MLLGDGDEGCSRPVWVGENGSDLLVAEGLDELQERVGSAGVHLLCVDDRDYGEESPVVRAGPDVFRL